ncbi:MAG: PKD domain-containing protein [Flavobacteriales bacterium]|nr:PKD domain-containing protein [Flavobacteriales bacterium]
MRKVVVMLCAVAGSLVNAQPFVIFNGTDNTCVGAFLDSGGQGGSGYSNNEDYTYTICPDLAGNAISLDFITALMGTGGAAPIDNMSIYDGDNTSAPLLGNWTGNTLQGQVISASAANSTGCLTVVWHSNNNSLGSFAASISCSVPCARPTAVASMVGGAPAKICPGEAVSFNGNASFAAPGFAIAQWLWDFGDGLTSSAGPVVSHNFASPGEYIVQLYLQDNNGCASTNRVDLQVLVGTEPTFTGTGGDLIGCPGQTLCFDGVVNPTTWSATPTNSYGTGVLLPDDVGSCFESELTFSQFAPGQTLTNINDLLSICFDIEHTFLGDLIITIISPSGESVILHQQGGAGTYLGIPNDFDDANPIPGTCQTYCIDPLATNGTMAANAAATLPPGSYESVDPLSGLLGSSLNGTWTLEICDMWAADNGFLCGFTLDFDPSLYPSLTTFTPVYGAGCDSTWWTGPGIVSTSSDCDQICVQQASPGQYNYVYHAVDDFGCTYDTTVTVTIVSPLVISAGADVQLCAGANTQLNATVLSGGMQPSSCDYTLELFDSAGDGWDGASVTVTVNGVATAWTLNNGSAGSTSISLWDGDVIQISYNPSLFFNGEHSYDILDANGNILFADGPGPSNGLAWSGVADCGPNVLPSVYTWTPSTGLSNPNIANPIATPGATTTYTVTVSQPGYPGCDGTDQVTVTIVTPNGAGTDGTVTVCSTDAPFDLYSYLGSATPGGSWTAPGGGATPSTFTPGTSAAGVYTYSVASAAPCPGLDQSTVTVTVVNPPDPGTNGAVTVCSIGAAISLFAQLGGAPQAGGTWSGPSAVVGGMFTPGSMSAGNYTYSLPAAAPCPAMSTTVAVTVNQPPDPGTAGSITVCSTGAAVDLFAQLGGTPDAGGTWSGPSAVVGGMFDPASMTAGVYTYTVTGAAPCPDETATVTVTTNTPPDPGTNGTISLCSTSTAADLFAQLGGTPDAGGTWSGPSAVVGGMFDPATMTAGVYTYTVSGTSPCPDETATVTVTINTPPDPGTNGNITLCSTSAAADLFTQLGGMPDAGGTWSGPSAVVGGMFDPATMTAGVYTYTVSGTSPCPDETATVTVTINTPPDPGTNGNITLCSTSAAADLFTQLGGMPDAGGTWSGPSAVVGGMFDPASMSAGVYTYTVSGTSPCPDETATVTVTINTPPDPGTNGNITLCSTSAAADLFAQLGGMPDAGGTWSGPSAVVGGMFDPATMTAGVYTYTVSGTSPCPDETATVTVTINTPPDPGTNGTVTLCSTSAAADLFTQLGGTPDASGIWSGPSAVAGGMIDPATMIAGVYSYTVAGTAPCPEENATVTVTINTPPDPGTNGSITLCTSSAATSLFAQLGGTPDVGGAWSGPSAVVGGLFDPASMSAGVYTYTVPGPVPCPDETATVTVTINTPPDPGSNGTITLCSTSVAADLFGQLSGTPDPGGTWSGPSLVVGGMIDPATMSAGVYTYTLTGTAPCPDESATVTVIIEQQPNAGIDGGLTLCSSSPSTALFGGLSGTPDAAGVWTGPGGSVSNGQFIAGTNTPGTYTYTVSGTAPCPNASATVNVVVVTNPDAGTPGAITLCTSDVASLLFDVLGGTPDGGGAWTGPSPVVGGQFDPATMTAGVYTYTISVPPPCTDASSTVTISINTPPDPGVDGALILCATSPAASLATGLGGTPDAGGTWNGPSAVVGGQFDPATMTAGVYTYTVNGTAPCPPASASVTVTVVTNPDAGTPGAITLCTTDASADLFTQLGGTPDAGGTWTGPSAIVGGQFDPATMNAGIYTYTYQRSTALHRRQQHGHRFAQRAAGSGS